MATEEKKNGFWQRVIDRRTEIETRKAELMLEGQIGVRSHPLWGDVTTGLKQTGLSIIKYPSMFAAGVFGSGKPGDQTVDMPAMPDAFIGTELETGLKQRQEQMQKGLDQKKKALQSALVEGEGNLWERYKRYYTVNSVARQSKFRENLTLPTEASLVGGIGAVALAAIVKGATKHTLDATLGAPAHATGGDLGTMASPLIGTVGDSIGSLLAA